MKYTRETTETCAIAQLWMNVGGLSEHIVCSTSLGSPIARARPVLGQHQQDGDFGHGDVFDDVLDQDDENL